MDTYPAAMLTTVKALTANALIVHVPVFVCKAANMRTYLSCQFYALKLYADQAVVAVQTNNGTAFLVRYNGTDAEEQAKQHATELNHALYRTTE